MAKILLGVNCNCFTNRYDEPEEWTRVCADLGVRHAMFNIDLIDPYWPWELQKRLCDRTLVACEQQGISIWSSFGGRHSHQHYMGHPEPSVRLEAEEFFRRAIRQTAYLGGRSFGTCFAILTVSCHNDPALRKRVIADAVAIYHRLAEYGAEVGIQALAYEMTSVPRETCATFEENDYVLDCCAHMAIPLRVCLDLGHRYTAGTDEERDHLAWIRRYGSRCDVIDCQQTDLAASRHWPFTEEYNAKGVIRGDEVVAAVEDSGAREMLLALEVHSSAYHPQESRHLRDLEESVRYWRQWVAD